MVWSPRRGRCYWILSVTVVECWSLPLAPVTVRVKLCGEAPKYPPPQPGERQNGSERKQQE